MILMEWYWWLFSVIGGVVFVVLVLFLVFMYVVTRENNERKNTLLLSVAKSDQSKYLKLFNRELLDIEAIFLGELIVNAEYINSLVLKDLDSYEVLIDQYIATKYQNLSIKLSEFEANEIKIKLYKLGAEAHTIIFMDKDKLSELQALV
jgi:hypothetical protein